MYLPISDPWFFGSMEFGESNVTNSCQGEAIEFDASESGTSSNGAAAPTDVIAEDNQVCHNGLTQKVLVEALPNGLSQNVSKLNSLVNSQHNALGPSTSKSDSEPGLPHSSVRSCCHSSTHSLSSDELDCDGMDQYFEDSSLYRNNGHGVCSNVEGPTFDRVENKPKVCCRCEKKECVTTFDGAHCSQHVCASNENGSVANGVDGGLQKWTHCSCPNLCDGAANCVHCESQPSPFWQDHPNPRNDVLSPDMDFLDFDFDPVPSGDETQGAESDNSSEGRPQSPQLDAEVFLPFGRRNDLGGPSDHVQNCCIHSLSFQNLVSSPKYQNNCLRPLVRSNLELHNVEDICSDNTDSDSANLEACGERLLRRESSLFNIPSEEMDYEEYNLQSALLNSFSAKPVGDKQASFSPDELTVEGFSSSNASSPDDPPVEKVLIWSELEACNRQVTQIGTSACGATAVINVLMALLVSFEKEEIEAHIHTRLRAETAPLASYLMSRSSAGTTHEDLVEGIHQLTGGTVYGRFFHFYPSRSVHLLKWLGSWIKKGAVPIASLNLQCGVASGQSIPDSWHHQMVFGVGPKGVYLTNPLECVPESQILEQLCSDSVLLIRRIDIVNRWGDSCDFSALMTNCDRRWQELNVIGQVINVFREATAPWIPGYRRHLTTHVRIPAAYKSGITLFVHTNSDAYRELIASSELPFANESE